MVKPFFVVCLALVFFIETIGIQIYRHSCRQTGDVHVSLFHADEHPVSEENQSLPACCKKPKKSCCETEFSCLALKVDYLKGGPNSFPLPWLASVPSEPKPLLTLPWIDSEPPVLAPLFPPPDRFISCSRTLVYQSLLL